MRRFLVLLFIVALLALLVVLLYVLLRGSPRSGPPSPGVLPPQSPAAVPTTAPASPPNYPGQGFTLYFIDVGQGDATLVVDHSGASLLVDGGRSGRRIRDRLQRLNVQDLDAIVITHNDADHIGGLEEVLDLYTVEHVYVNGAVGSTKTYEELTAAVQAEGSAITAVSRGDFINLGGLKLSVLHPGVLAGDSNVDSVVLKVECGVVSALLTGDAEAESERDMLKAGVLGDVDVLKVGHHGSRSSTSPEFLAQVKPEVGVISAGLENSYGHPHQEVVDRLKAAQVQLLMTDTTNADNTLAMTSDCATYQFLQPAQPLGN